VTPEAVVLIAVDLSAVFFVAWAVLLERGLIDPVGMRSLGNWERARRAWR
jgi:hypothetical protein